MSRRSPDKVLGKQKNGVRNQESVERRRELNFKKKEKKERDDTCEGRIW